MKIVNRDGIIMEEIFDYLYSELSELKILFDLSSDELRKLNSELDVVESTISKFSNKQDEAQNIFSPVKMETNFNEYEIEKLQSRRKSIKEKISTKEFEVEKYNMKINKIKALIDNEKNSIIHANNLEMVEKDRQRIANDIHDTVVQNIFAVIIKNQFITQIIDSDIQRAKLELEVENKLLKQSVDELRNIIYDLRPMALNDLGFENQVNDVIERLKQNTKMNIHFRFKGDEKCVDEIIAISSIRIIQELCNNSIKHSRGKNIYLEININENILKITESDDGIGFDFNELINKKDNSNNTGFGLSILQERILFIKGNLNFSCEEKYGIKCEVTIPLRKEK